MDYDEYDGATVSELDDEQREEDDIIYDDRCNYGRL